MNVLLVLTGERAAEMIEAAETKAVYADTPTGREDTAARVLYEQLRITGNWVEVPKHCVRLDRSGVVKVWRSWSNLIWVERHVVQVVASGLRLPGLDLDVVEKELAKPSVYAGIREDMHLLIQECRAHRAGEPL